MRVDSVLCFELCSIVCILFVIVLLHVYRSHISLPLLRFAHDVLQCTHLKVGHLEAQCGISAKCVIVHAGRWSLCVRNLTAGLRKLMGRRWESCGGILVARCHKDLVGAHRWYDAQTFRNMCLFKWTFISALSIHAITYWPTCTCTRISFSEQLLRAQRKYRKQNHANYQFVATLTLNLTWGRTDTRRFLSALMVLLRGLRARHSSCVLSRG